MKLGWIYLLEVTDKNLSCKQDIGVNLGRSVICASHTCN